MVLDLNGRVLAAPPPEELNPAPPAGPGPARDRVQVRVQRRHVSFLLYAVVSSAAVATIFITLGLLVFIILHRKIWSLAAGPAGPAGPPRPPRSTGPPSQDLLLLLAVLLSVSSVLVSGLDGSSVPDWIQEICCSVRLWFLSLGHSVGLAVLFTRTWRIYSLFTVQQKETRLQRAGRIQVWFFLLEVLVLTCWQVLDPLRRVQVQHRPQGDPDLLIRFYSDQCSSTSLDLWLTAVYGYRAPLLGLGCFLALNIRVKPLSFSMLAVSVSSVSGVSGSLLITHNPPLHFLLSSFLILTCSIVILGCLFGPQVSYVLSSGGETQQQLDRPDEAPDGEPDEESDEVPDGPRQDQLRRLNDRLKSQSQQLDVQIHTIMMELAELAEPELGRRLTGDKRGKGSVLTFPRPGPGSCLTRFVFTSS
ncbi:gamma-aminobutyric acid type B receptor subunit 2-like [Cololabis saira]|uniref:gamma-aminobutyric acid type B receptor subunit 2-like n=1 Tax=Cololabis saira TaxID=129043 RepID=UPI002AD4FC78|nr:gamma-aminobutyric acid type B receptor subunit 2-like [Cololabis saira]